MNTTTSQYLDATPAVSPRIAALIPTLTDAELADTLAGLRASPWSVHAEIALVEAELTQRSE